MDNDKKNINEDALDEEEKQTDTGSEDNENTGNDNQDNTGGSEGNDNGDDDKKAEKTFTQAQVNAMMAKEKKQGRAAAFREMGIDPKDKAKVAQFKAFVDSTKTDAEKKAEEEADAFAKDKELALANAKVEIMKQGVKAQYVDDAVALVMAQLDDDNDVGQVLASFKSKYPVWFEPDKEEKDKTGQKGTGSSVKGDKQGGGGSYNKSLGSRLAAQRRKSNNKKSSYWK